MVEVAEGVISLEVVSGLTVVLEDDVFGYIFGVFYGGSGFCEYTRMMISNH